MSQNSQETPAMKHFFDVAGRCFPVNFAISLGIDFRKKYSGSMLLHESFSVLYFFTYGQNAEVR